ncbi:RNA-dependent RNA polymerase [Entamoeba marina]
MQQHKIPEQWFQQLLNQLLEVNDNSEKKEKLIHNLQANEGLRNRFNYFLQQKHDILKEDKVYCNIFQSLLKEFIKLGFDEILISIWDLFDFIQLCVDDIKKLIYLFVCEYKIIRSGHRECMYQLIQQLPKYEVYFISLVCQNTIDINYLKELNESVNSKQSKHLLTKTIHSIKVLTEVGNKLSCGNGLVYNYLIFHNDFMKTIDYITTQLHIPIYDHIIEMNELNTNLLEKKFNIDGSGDLISVCFALNEGCNVQRLMNFKKASIIQSLTFSKKVFIIKCSFNALAIILEHTISSITTSFINNNGSLLTLHLTQPPLLYRTHTCGCVIRSTTKILGKTNCVIIKFLQKKSTKMFTDFIKTNPFPLKYVNYIPSFTYAPHSISHLYCYNHLKLVSDANESLLEDFFQNCSLKSIIIFLRLVHFGHIPLRSQLKLLMDSMKKPELNYDDILQSTPMKLHDYMKAIIPWLINFNWNSICEIEIKTPSRILNLGYHPIPFSNSTSQVVYFRDDDGGDMDYCIIQSLLSDEEFGKDWDIGYNLDDLLNGKVWMKNGYDTIQRTPYYLHYPLYLNSYSIQQLFSIDKKNQLLPDIVTDLITQFETPSLMRFATLNFLEISPPHQLEILAICSNYYKRYNQLTTMDYLLTHIVSNMISYRLNHGLLPILHGGTFYFMMDPTRTLQSGEISLVLNSTTPKSPTTLLILSPFFEKSDSIRLFTNKRFNTQFLSNVVYYSISDQLFFQQMEIYKNVCNCVWDPRILQEFTSSNQFNEMDFIPDPIDETWFSSTSIKTFFNQYIKIRSGRITAKGSNSIMQEILNPLPIEEETYDYIPPQPMKYTITPPMFKKKSNNVSNTIGNLTKSLFYYLEGISDYKRTLHFQQQSSPWSLQITGYVDDPFRSFQIQEVFNLFTNEKIGNYFEDSNSVLFHCIVFLLTNMSTPEYLTSYVDLKVLKEKKMKEMDIDSDLHSI